MKKWLLILALSPLIKVNAQSYSDTIYKWRKNYQEDFVKEPRSPLKAADTGYLRFYTPNPEYKVVADFKLTPSAKTFDMRTHSGKLKKFRQYGLVTFKIHDTLQTLEVYQNIDLIKKDKKFEEELFIPFNDQTNYITTYAGGRYIDLSVKDIKDGKLVVDFNKSYNPYCAFAEGYSCPIPPDANKLKVAIEAGEMLWERSK